MAMFLSFGEAKQRSIHFRKAEVYSEYQILIILYRIMSEFFLNSQRSKYRLLESMPFKSSVE